MLKEGGPLIPLGSRLDKWATTKNAVVLLERLQRAYDKAIIYIAINPESNTTLSAARQIAMEIDKRVEQLKDYENFKAEGRGKRGRFTVDEKKLKRLLPAPEHKLRVINDVTAKISDMTSPQGN